MDIVIDYLSNDFLKFFGGFSLFGVLIAAAAYVSRLMAKQVFNKSMEKYRKEISLEFEKLKLQQQKNFKDFELFTSKKHKKYPKMYYLLEAAYGQIFALRGLGRFLTFKNVNEEDLSLYFDELTMTSFDKSRILEIWRTNNQHAVDEIRKIEKVLKYQIARQKWLEANNYYIYNILYFSDDVSKSCEQLLNNLHDYLLYLEPDFVFTSPEMTIKPRELRETILPEDRDKVRTEMKKELRIL